MCLLEKGIKYTARMYVINFMKNVLCNGEKKMEGNGKRHKLRFAKLASVEGKKKSIKEKEEKKEKTEMKVVTAIAIIVIVWTFYRSCHWNTSGYDYYPGKPPIARFCKPCLVIK